MAPLKDGAKLQCSRQAFARLLPEIGDENLERVRELARRYCCDENKAEN